MVTGVFPWQAAAVAVLLSGLSAAAAWAAFRLLLARWQGRGIELTARDVLLAVLAGWGSGAVVGLAAGPASGAAFAAWAAAGCIAVASDVRCRLIPSGAMWTASGLGLLALAAARATGQAPPDAPVTLVALLAVSAAFAAFALVAGGIGGGDLRLMAAGACTLWWVPMLPLLAALLAANAAALCWMLATRRRSAAMGPFIAGGYSLAAVAFALLG
jgi:hypothetical protein